MTNENGKPDEHDETQTTDLDAAPSDLSPEELERAAQAIEAKFGLLVNVAMLSIMTLLRLIKAKGPEAIGEAELEQFEQMKQSVHTAVEAVDELSESEELEGTSIDLEKLRAKLDLLVRRIDDFPADEIEIDSTPPS